MRIKGVAVPFLVAVVLLTIYLRTLFPGIGGGGDAVKFQYLGSVLGTAHPPGYPLFIWLSYLFSWLPFGVMAHRMNVMSAIFATLAALVAWTVLRRERCHPAVAGIAAVSLGLGRTFWSKSLAAEVYSLNALLVLLVIWQAVRWADTGRRRDLYLTAAFLGLSLGNHLTAAMIAPALVVFVVVTRPSTVRVKPVLISVGLGALGLCQYLFIILRTRQGAAYVEASASNLTELVHVVLASKYSDEMFVFNRHQLLTQRLPGIAGLFAAELGAGVVFFALGVAWGIRTRSTPVLLFVVSLLAVAGLTLNIDADVDGFLLPAFAMAWLVAGLGMQAAYGWACRQGRLGASAAGLVLGMIPLSLILQNYRANDHHRRTYETRYMNALFHQLEDRAAFVREEYAKDQLVLYKVAGEHADAGRRVELIGSDIDDVQRHAQDHFAIYAFDTGRSTLEGFGLRFTEVQLNEVGPAFGSGPATPIDMTPLRLFRLRAWAPCMSVGNLGWQDVTTAGIVDPIVVRLDNYRPFDARATFYAANDTPLDPVLAASDGPSAPRVVVATFRASSRDDVARLVESLTHDDVPPSLRAALLAGPFVHRLDLVVNDQGQSSRSVVGLGVGATRIITRLRVDLDAPRRGVVCGWSDRSFFETSRHEPVSIEDTDAELFGRGWQPPTTLDTGERGRWIEDSTAELAVFSRRHGAVRVHVRAAPSDDDHHHTLAITVNGRPSAAEFMPNEWHEFEWYLPDGVFRDGLNRVTIDVGGQNADPKEHPAVVGAIAFDFEEARP